MLLDFKNLNGRVPKDSDNCPRIYRWWGNQRKLYREKMLEQDKIDKFKSNGFVLDEWEDNYNLLIDFKKKNGRFPLQKDGKIGIWYNTQRQNYRDGILKKETLHNNNWGKIRSKARLALVVFATEKLSQR